MVLNGTPCWVGTVLRKVSSVCVENSDEVDTGNEAHGV